MVKDTNRTIDDFMRSSFGAAFPLFAGAMFSKLGVGWASSLLGFLALLFVPIPFLLYKVSHAKFEHYASLVLRGLLSENHC